MSAKLVAETGEFEGAEYPLSPKGAILGRLKSNDIEVRDTKASRRHTRVGVRDGAWIVEDLKSSNGTFVNGDKIDSLTLSPGDKISIGKTVYRFEMSAAPAPAREKPKTRPKPAAAPKPKPRPKPATKPRAMPPVERRAPAETIEPEELHLEEPEELGLDDDPSDAGALAAPAAPRAPAPPPAESKPERPQVSATGHGIVSVSSTSGPPRRAGLLTQDVGQRNWQFQLIVYVVGLAIFVAVIYFAFTLTQDLMGDPNEAQPIESGDTPAPGKSKPKSKSKSKK